MSFRDYHSNMNLNVSLFLFCLTQCISQNDLPSMKLQGTSVVTDDMKVQEEMSSLKLDDQVKFVLFESVKM